MELLEAIDRKTAQATQTESTILGVDMAPPRKSSEKQSALLKWPPPPGPGHQSSEVRVGV
jgi:hypothetical protein